MVPEKTVNPEYCSITEQGDLGLGAEVLGEADQKVLSEQTEEKEER